MAFEEIMLESDKGKMKALIIAAGRGSRLNGLAEDRPKSLIKVLGLSLIERVILTAEQPGIDEFVITVGYFGERIKANLGGANLERAHLEGANLKNAKLKGAIMPDGTVHK